MPSDYHYQRDLGDESYGAPGEDGWYADAVNWMVWGRQAHIQTARRHMQAHGTDICIECGIMDGLHARLCLEPLSV